ncbi:hypothetical protein H2201_005540 [Coniosporium apollinis]|uniref:RNase III domain-containing protein n=1 Tax=Coniosporium apollinis TaxID=61459 RepID=A0ABQ9NRQ5_9PEZI|nr:hypothetical protein H2201_005540 [Coniosporium apollinis]
MVEGCQAILGYQFNDSDLLWEALQAAGSPVVYIGARHLRDGNKRLALLGDTVLKLVLVREWYTSGRDRAVVDQILSSVGSNANLNSVGQRNGLSSFVNGNPSQRGVVPPNTMAATVEATLGAVFLDSGLQSVAEVMQTLGLMPA